MVWFLNLIISQSLPISIFPETEFRFQTKYNTSFSRNTVISVILKLVEVVEEKIIDDLRDRKGSIIYDGWKISSTHYLVIIDAFTKKISILKEKVPCIHEEVSMPLISISPISQVVEDLEENIDQWLYRV